MKSRAADDDWVRAEYERQMGADALKRQTAEREKASKPPECECGWKGEKSERPGPHHSQACPLHQVEPDA